MSTVAAWTINLHGVLPAMGGGVVKGDRAALVIELAYYRVVFERESSGTQSCLKGEDTKIDGKVNLQNCRTGPGTAPGSRALRQYNK
jgi:hypothetical protein